MAYCVTASRRDTSLVIVLSAVLLAGTLAVSAQTPVPGGCVTPASQRTGEIGCYLSAIEVLGAMGPGHVYWHLHTYPTRAAAEAVKGPHGTVVEAFGKVWRYTIAEEGWRPTSGERVAVLGPFPIVAGKRYVARYMEAAFTQGMHSSVHRHSGPEAWYLISGAQCLETPSGTIVAHGGESAVVPEGPAMILSSVGTETRRSVLLVLHDESEPWMTHAHDWHPQGSCPK
jgi:quercetin dioxygenase-like cupin family protein